MLTKETRLYENKDYNEAQARNYENTENSDEKKESDQRRLTNGSTRTDTENNSGIREETARQESSSTHQNMALDLNVIPAPSDSQNNEDELNNENQLNNLAQNRTRENRVNSPNDQTPQTINNSKKIFEVINEANTNTSNTLGTTHSRDTKDNQIIKVIRWPFNSICKYLNYRCERQGLGLQLEKVDVRKLFGNIHKQRWFIRRKIKILLASNPDNKRIIKKMMKVDRIFKRFVELKFEDFFNNHFLLNNRYLPLDENTSIFLSHFKSFGKYLKDELDKSKNEIEKRKNIEYIKKLIKTGHTLIDEIKGRGVYLSRCKRKRIMTKIYIIKYK